MTVQIHDSYSRRKVDLPPPPGPIGMYFCGPTVYQRIHIGNARLFALSMCLRRWLALRGYEVKLAENVTDINDLPLPRVPVMRGVQALVAVAPSEVPGRAIARVRRPLRDHVKPWLFWTEHARGLTPNTIVSYALDAKMFVAFCEQIGCVYAEDVPYQIIEAYGAAQRAGLGLQATTVARRYSALKQLFRFLMREGVVSANPVELAIRMKLPPRKPPEHMTMEERELIFTTLGARRDLAGQRHYTLSLFLFYSGLREDETVHLKVEDVHLEPAATAYLRVRDGKGSKDRLVPIVPRLRETLAVYLATTRRVLPPRRFTRTSRRATSGRSWRST